MKSLTLPHIDIRNQNKLIQIFVATSVALHMLVLIVSQFELGFQPTLQLDEWSMETDLLLEADLSESSASSLPQAKQAEETKVPETLLPQLPERFAIDEKKQDDPDEMTSEETKAAENAEKKAEQSKAPAAVAKIDDAANKIAAEDALRRLALEKLRKDEKLAKTYEANQKDAIARLKGSSTESLAQQALGAGGLASQRAYQQKLTAYIRKFWSIPEAYRLKNANIETLVAVRVSASGTLMSTTINKSSGDSVFDEMVLKTLQNAAPLPAPPRDQAGTEILIRFSPKTM